MGDPAGGGPGGGTEGCFVFRWCFSPGHQRAILAAMSLARIPFTEADHQVIRTLNGWMLFLAIIHFIAAFFVLTCGCLATFGAVAAIAQTPLGGVFYTLQMMTLPVLGAVMLTEGIFVLQARSALGRLVDTDTDDQAELSAAFNKLKLFFMLELGWFTITILSGLAGLIVQIVAPELARPGGFQMNDSGAGWNMGGGQ